MFIKEIAQGVLHVREEEGLTAEEAARLEASGYSKVIDGGTPPGYDPETMSLHVSYEKTDSGQYMAVYATQTDTEKIRTKIDALKAELAASDYKIIKMLEYSMLPALMSNGEPGVNSPPYDIETVHSERQALRDEINRLEQLTDVNGI